MTPSMRKLLLTVHVTASVGWLGAVLAYLAVAITGLTSANAELARSAYLVLELMIWRVILPCAAGALLTGLLQSLGTHWGLFGHYWVASKFFLSLIGTIVLLAHSRRVAEVARSAAAEPDALNSAGMLRTGMVIHAAGGLVILLVATVLSIYKPWGKTAYGRRMQTEGGSR